MLPTSPPKIHIATGFKTLSNELKLLETAFSASQNVLHQKRNTIKRVQFGQYSVAVKSFKKPNKLQGWVYANLRRSKARRSFEHAERLIALDINTPAPIAYIEYVYNHRLGKSYYISLHHQYKFTMQEVMSNLDDIKINIIKAFTCFTFDIHQKGVLHLDHNAGNTLINEKHGNFIFSIIDINRMQFKSLSLRQRLNNFIRLTDNPVILKIFAETYANCINASPKKCQHLLFKLKRAHNNKLRFKRHIKKALGR